MSTDTAPPTTKPRRKPLAPARAIGVPRRPGEPIDSYRARVEPLLRQRARERRRAEFGLPPPPPPPPSRSKPRVSSSADLDTGHDVPHNSAADHRRAVDTARALASVERTPALPARDSQAPAARPGARTPAGVP